MFGQKNEEENDSKEVIRVVKYSKDWQRLGAASLYGANTTVHSMRAACGAPSTAGICIFAPAMRCIPPTIERITNYVKLRDLAYYLNGTKAQFAVEWNAARGIKVSSGRPYTPNGSELSTPFSGNRAFQAGMSQTEVNFAAVNLGSIVLTDDNGGAYTYYKLRDLGRSLGFNVSYINGQVVINTNQPYSDAQ